MLLDWGSNCQQLPHQLLNVPLTSGVVYVLVTLLISTWNVTL